MALSPKRVRSSYILLEKVSKKQAIKVSPKAQSSYKSEADAVPVGMNAMVTQFDRETFSEDAYAFRPERWLESDARYWAIEEAMLVFGAGRRTYIGKHVIAFKELRVETDAARSSLLLKCTKWFPRSCVDSKSTWHMITPWKTHNTTLILQTDVICKFKRRSAF